MILAGWPGGIGLTLGIVKPNIQVVDGFLPRPNHRRPTMVGAQGDQVVAVPTLE